MIFFQIKQKFLTNDLFLCAEKPYTSTLILKVKKTVQLGFFIDFKKTIKSSLKIISWFFEIIETSLLLRAYFWLNIGLQVYRGYEPCGSVNPKHRKQGKP